MPRHSIFLLVLVGIVPLDAPAAVFERDWKAPGDGLLTYDDVNRREWLDLTVQSDIPNPKFENVVAELVPGGMFEGFTVAGRDDVTGLAISAGVTVATSEFETNESSVNLLIDLLGDVPAPPATGVRRLRGSIGETFNLDPLPPFQVAASFEVESPPFDSRAEIRFLSGRQDGFPSRATPVFLYRGAIPEPNTICLLILAAACSVIRVRDRS